MTRVIADKGYSSKGIPGRTGRGNRHDPFGIEAMSGLRRCNSDLLGKFDDGARRIPGGW
jgi:hypothetical protein